jgi:hypothetical protein
MGGTRVLYRNGARNIHNFLSLRICMKLQVDFGEHTHESFPRVFRYKVKLLWEIEEKEKGSSWANQYLYHGAHHRCSRLVAGEDLSFPAKF